MTVVFAFAAGALLAGVGAVIAMRTRLLVLTIQGSSMNPTLRDGDRVLLLRTRTLPNRGSVVAVHTRGLDSGAPAAFTLTAPDLMVKRLVAVAGDPAPTSTRRPVPSGEVYLLGDNPRSLDSRTWGTVGQHLVVGKVVRTLRRSAARA